MTMSKVKVWCKECAGHGKISHNHTCEKCLGYGYSTRSFRELAHDYKITLDPLHDAHFSINERDRYDITDAQADAAVLTGLDTYAMATEREEQIVDAIYARLHAFYCGGQDDKR